MNELETVLATGPTSLGQAHRLLQEQAARIAELESPWISVEDRLPEYRALMYTPDDEAIRYRIVPKGLARSTSDATHWMPLPDPPKENAPEAK